MPSREFKGKRLAVYPEYIDSTRSRGMGRKISGSDAVKRPRLAEVVRAAVSLGLDPLVEEGKRYPRNWMYGEGVVLVLKKWGRQETLRRIASVIREFRERKK